MQLLKNFKRLEASSVLESVIAISIISICALLAFTIYLNVISQDKPMHYYQAKHKIEFLAQQVLQNKDYEDGFFIYKGYTIDKAVTVNQSDDTALLMFTLKTANKTYHIKKIMPYHEK